MNNFSLTINIFIIKLFYTNVYNRPEPIDKKFRILSPLVFQDKENKSICGSYLPLLDLTF